MNKEKIRVLVIAGSSRRVTNCPAANSKASYLSEKIKNYLPKEWIVDYFNIGNDYLLPKIQSCNGCVSTSMALCVWPCNCYKRHSFFELDLMWDEDLYARIYAADAIIVIAPINRYSPTSSMKLLFDRLVCANGGNPDEKLIDHKDGKLAAKLENSQIWDSLSINHLEGRTAAFFTYGDEGGDESDESGMPKILENKSYFDPKAELEEVGDGYKAYKPVIFQLRYSGIEVPDNLVKYIAIGADGKYNQDQIKQLKKNKEVLDEFEKWAQKVKDFVEKKGKVKPGKYPLNLKKPDSEMSTFTRQLQLLIRKVFGALWMHTFGYYTSRRVIEKYRLDKDN